MYLRLRFKLLLLIDITPDELFLLYVKDYLSIVLVNKICFDSRSCNSTYILFPTVAGEIDSSRTQYL